MGQFLVAEPGKLGGEVGVALGQLGDLAGVVAPRSRSRRPRCRRAPPSRPAGRCRRPGRSRPARQTGASAVGRTRRSVSSLSKRARCSASWASISAKWPASAARPGACAHARRAGRGRSARPPARPHGRRAGSRRGARPARRGRGAGGDGLVAHLLAALADGGQAAQDGQPQGDQRRSSRPWRGPANTQARLVAGRRRAPSRPSGRRPCRRRRPPGAARRRPAARARTSTRPRVVDGDAAAHEEHQRQHPAGGLTPARPAGHAHQRP